MKKFDYKWVVAALCFLMVFITLGFCSSSRSLYIAPVCEALGIKRSAFSINDTCRFIATSVTNMFFGTLVSRFGTKKLIGFGFLSLAASSFIYSFAPSIYLFYLGGVFLGVGLSFTTTTMVGAVINKWFRENRGTVMGAILASNGIGAAIATQIITPIIHRSTNIFSYRRAYFLTAIILIVAAAIILVFYKEKSSESSSPSKKSPRGKVWPGIEYTTAVKKPYFYGACICIFLSGLILQGTTGVVAAHFEDIGIDSTYIAAVLSAASLALSGSKFLVGFIYDRLGLRKTSNICFTCALGLMLIMLFSSNSALGRAFAMSYALFSAMALPLETIMLPIYAGDLFGEKSFNKILGIFVSVNTAGYALGSIFVNFFHDIFGNYNIAFIVCALLVLAAFITMQFVITAAHKECKRIESEIKG